MMCCTAPWGWFKNIRKELQYDLIFGSLIFDVRHVSVSDLAVTLILVKSLFVCWKMLRLWVRHYLTSLPAFPGGPAGPRGPIGPCYEYKHDHRRQGADWEGNKTLIIKLLYRSSLGWLVYLHLDLTLQPHQGHLGNPVAPTGAKCCE